MHGLAFGVILAAAIGAASGCTSGGAGRASDVQNVHGISDDITAVTGGTRTDNQRSFDPNYTAVIPSSYGAGGLTNRP